MSLVPCPACKGARLRPESRAVLVGGMAIHEFCALSVRRALAWLDEVELTETERHIARLILREIQRAAAVPGERRHRLPVDGPRGGDAVGRRGAADPAGDADRLGAGRRALRPRRAVDRPAPARQLEADRDARAPARPRQHRARRRARRADDARRRPPRRPRARARASTAARSSRRARPREVERVDGVADRAVPGRARGRSRCRRSGARRRATSRSAARAQHNLKKIDVQGAARRADVRDRRVGLGQVDARQRGALQGGRQPPAPRAPAARARTRAVLGLDQLDKIIQVDQSPIGRTPRSNPATYTGLFDVIRDLFSKTQEARARGYKPGRFSFNVKGGRCEVCRGDGQIKIEMHFLPDVYVPCEQCHGKRYNRETLDVRFKGKTIADVLDMPVEEALEFFAAHPEDPPAAGDAATTSGSATSGSASRRRRCRAARRSASSSRPSCRRSRPGATLYILDEPTTGLHFADVQRLLEVLHRLVDAGQPRRRHRAQPRRHQDRRPAHRHGPRGRRGGRHGRRRRHARGGRRHARLAHRRVPARSSSRRRRRRRARGRKGAAARRRAQRPPPRRRGAASLPQAAARDDCATANGRVQWRSEAAGPSISRTIAGARCPPAGRGGPVRSRGRASGRCLPRAPLSRRGGGASGLRRVRAARRRREDRAAAPRLDPRALGGLRREHDRARRRSCGRRSGAGTSATRCRGTARGSTGSSLRREAFARWPLHGNVLEALREGRLEIGAARPVRARRLDHRARRRRASASAAGRSSTSA